MPIVGGQIVKDGFGIEAGRTHTVLIENARRSASALKIRPAPSRFGVTVTSTDSPHAKVASFLSAILTSSTPSQVDVTSMRPEGSTGMR